jgi:hypothetical protein
VWFPADASLAGVREHELPAKGGVMEILWSAVTIVFVVGTLAVVAFATYRMFGGGHTPQH